MAKRPPAYTPDFPSYGEGYDEYDYDYGDNEYGPLLPPHQAKKGDEDFAEWRKRQQYGGGNLDPQTAYLQQKQDIGDDRREFVGKAVKNTFYAVGLAALVAVVTIIAVGATFGTAGVFVPLLVAAFAPALAGAVAWGYHKLKHDAPSKPSHQEVRAFNNERAQGQGMGHGISSPQQEMGPAYSSAQGLHQGRGSIDAHIHEIERHQDAAGRHHDAVERQISQKERAVERSKDQLEKLRTRLSDAAEGRVGEPIHERHK